MPAVSNPTRRLLLAATCLLGLALAGCGFHLRGAQNMDFATIDISGSGAQSELGSILRREIGTTDSTKVVSDPAQADVRLMILSNNREREILSLTGRGKVREYQLVQRVRFQLLDKTGATLVPPTEVLVRREYTFDDTEVLGKSQEEALLYRDMQNDLVQQLMRRLAAAKRPS